MDQFESLKHTKWDCKYHVVFIPKYRRKALYGDLKRHLGPVFRQLAEQRESRVEEGHLMPDHVHMLLSIPPKYAVSQVVGVHQRQERNPPRASLWRAKARVCRSKLLGTRIFRLDRRSRRNGDQGIYPESGKRRPKVGTTEPMALACHLQVAHKSGPR